ncbi:MAG: serine/threonine protein kinase [Polyangiaceae bacterium]|nr:serine/threonine protein kinase [Polyangiaceae bacterium]
MDSADSAVDHELRQARLSKFGRVLTLVTLCYVVLNFGAGLWLHRVEHNYSSLPLSVSTIAFGALWLLLRAPRSPRFVRLVELSTLFVGTAAISSTAVVIDLIAEPDMIVRSLLIDVLLVYAVYVPSTARRTLLVAALMTVPLLGSIFIAFRAWDPALHEPPAATWPKQNIGDMAYPATIMSTVWWGIAVAMAAGFSHTLYGLRKAVSDIRRLGQYTLERKLGEGGMGVVYRASHAMLRRPTAVKLLLPDRAGKDALARFEREVRRTAMLTHPNTVTVFDYGRTTDGVFYYAMELLEGASLTEIVEVDGPQPEERVLHLLEQAAASLAEAHEAGLIHRDVKPGNIMVVDRGGISDLVKVLDFGLVKNIASETDSSEPALTMTNAITGTPLYMAPETVTAPDTVDARTDLYALGAVGYWLLTGTHVFGGKTILEVCAHHLHTAPDSPSARLEAPVSADLEALIMSCLAKRPEDRPASANVLRERLRGCAAYGQWTNARGAQWWAAHRRELRSSGAEVSATGTTVDAQAPLVLVTRIAE